MRTSSPVVLYQDCTALVQSWGGQCWSLVSWLVLITTMKIQDMRTTMPCQNFSWKMGRIPCLGMGHPSGVFIADCYLPGGRLSLWMLHVQVSSQMQEIVGLTSIKTPLSGWNVQQNTVQRMTVYAKVCLEFGNSTAFGGSSLLSELAVTDLLC